MSTFFFARGSFRRFFPIQSRRRELKNARSLKSTRIVKIKVLITIVADMAICHFWVLDIEKTRRTGNFWRPTFRILLFNMFVTGRLVGINGYEGRVEIFWSSRSGWISVGDEGWENNNNNANVTLYNYFWNFFIFCSGQYYSAPLRISRPTFSTICEP